jgi:hypothetical protein
VAKSGSDQQGAGSSVGEWGECNEPSMSMY